MKVHIPTPLRSYTSQRDEVDANGATLRDLLTDLEHRHPGFRFRIIDEQDSIRQHIKIFVNQEQARDLSARLEGGDEIHIICALSGG